jgi:large subunit ribosomal protein L25
MYLLESKIRNNKLTINERVSNIMGIFYGKNMKNLQVSIDRKEFMNFLGQVKKSCYMVPLKLKIEGKEHNVIIKDIQWHKLTTNPEHIDFFSIAGMEDLHEKNNINLKYDVDYINKETCIGLKLGGKLNITMKKIQCSANPYKMNPVIQIDLKNLKIGEKITSEFLEEKYAHMNLKISNKGTLVSIIGGK